jgi:vanillate O-demethylase monooxygenase subunit
VRLPLIDIQLDATHATYVHVSTLASDAIQETPPEVIRDGDLLHVRRWMLDVAPPPIWVSAGGFTGNVDRWILATYDPPSLCSFDIGAAVAGTGAPEGERSHGITNRTTHFMTPASTGTTHYFWLFARNYGLDDEALSERVHGLIAETFHEDVEIVERQQKSIAADTAGTQVDVNADRPTVQARRLLDRLISAEAERGAPA